MIYTPEKAGERAGLVAFHNATHYYVLAVADSEGRPVIELRMRAGRTTPTADSVVASAPLAVPANRRAFLKIDARDGRYDFAYATRENAWQVLHTDADGTVLRTKVAGGFVGTILGMYAQRAAP